MVVSVLFSSFSYAIWDRYFSQLMPKDVCWRLDPCTSFASKPIALQEAGNLRSDSRREVYWGHKLALYEASYLPLAKKCSRRSAILKWFLARKLQLNRKQKENGKTDPLFDGSTYRTSGNIAQGSYSKFKIINDQLNPFSWREFFRDGNRQFSRPVSVRIVPKNSLHNVVRLNS